jgi:hypothetical protein
LWSLYSALPRVVYGANAVEVTLIIEDLNVHDMRLVLALSSPERLMTERDMSAKPPSTPHPHPPP